MIPGHSSMIWKSESSQLTAADVAFAFMSDSFRLFCRTSNQIQCARKMNDSESNNIFGRKKYLFIEINFQRSQPETYARGLENNYHLGVVDGARPWISRRGSSGGGVAGDIAGDAGVGLNLGIDVGAHLDRVESWAENLNRSCRTGLSTRVACKFLGAAVLCWFNKLHVYWLNWVVS